MQRFTIESTGNGATYIITRLADGASVFLQGDDAVQFGKSLETTSARFTDDDAAGLYECLMPAAK